MTLCPNGCGLPVREGKKYAEGITCAIEFLERLSKKEHSFVSERVNTEFKNRVLVK